MNKTLTYKTRVYLDTEAMKLRIALVAVSLLMSVAVAAPTKVIFWHYVGPEESQAALQKLVTAFNRSQNKYEVQAIAQGDNNTLAIKTIAAARANTLPAMAMVDNAFFTRLVGAKLLTNLDPWIDTLPKSLVNDIYPVLWEYGNVAGKRYGLPWASSSLVLYYNADAFRVKNINPPRTWDEFVNAAKQLTNRGAKGAMVITDAWQFVSFVTSRGGSMLTANERPDFDNPTAVGTLELFYDLVRSGNIVARDLGELNLAVLDFLRTKVSMVVAPTSAYPLAFRYAYAFKLGVVPLPNRTVAGESQLAVFNSADPQAQRGAFEFWQFLIRSDNLADWVKASYYLPVRRSVATGLESVIAANPVLDAGMRALERSFNLPRLVEFNDWRHYLELALERSLKGGVAPQVALAEAQRLSLTVVPPR